MTKFNKCGNILTVKRIYDIQPKPTIYRGVLYRSQLESKWARFFDTCGIQHKYEAAQYYIEQMSVRYTPDFKVFGCNYHFVEIKPTSPTAEEYMKCIHLSLYLPTVLLAGECNPEKMKVYLFSNGVEVGLPALWKFIKAKILKIDVDVIDNIAKIKSAFGRKRDYMKAFEEVRNYRF